MNTFYFYTKPDKKKNRLSFAGVIADGQINVGIAQCSKHDTFAKKFGRRMAEVRATRKPFAQIPLKEDDNAGRVFVDYCKAQSHTAIANYFENRRPSYLHIVDDNE